MSRKDHAVSLYMHAPMYRRRDIRLRSYHGPALLAALIVAFSAGLGFRSLLWGFACFLGGLIVAVAITEAICALLERRRSFGRAGGGQRAHTAAYTRPWGKADAAPPTIPARRRPLWSALCAQYGDPAFASWVIAAGPHDAADDDLLSIAHASYPDWTPQHGSSEQEIARHEAAHALAAHVLGAVVLGVTLRARGKSNVEYVMPLSGPETRDAAWRRMVINVAGRALDRSEGRSTTGSTDDLAKALLWAHAILSTGTPPEGYEGPMTTDGLMTAAHGAAERLVGAHKAYVDAVAATLVRNAVVGGSELREMLPAHK